MTQSTWGFAIRLSSADASYWSATPSSVSFTCSSSSSHRRWPSLCLARRKSSYGSRLGRYNRSRIWFSWLWYVVWLWCSQACLIAYWTALEIDRLPTRTSSHGTCLTKNTSIKSSSNCKASTQNWRTGCERSHSTSLISVKKLSVYRTNLSTTSTSTSTRTWRTRAYRHLWEMLSGRPSATSSFLVPIRPILAQSST